MKQFDVVSLGELNPDIILADIRADAPVLGTEQEIGTFKKTLGSSTAITTVRLARFGLKTALVAKLGNDDDGRFCLNALQEEGVNTNYILTDNSLQTGVTVSLTYATDRLLATYPGAMNALRAEEVPDTLLASSRHLHVASFYLQTALQAGLADLFQKAKAQGLTTSLDTGWDPQERWQYDTLRSNLEHTDIFFPNEKELFEMTKTSDSDEAAKQILDQGVGMLVLKRGSQGANLYTQAAAPLKSTAFSTKVVDTTGAGDSFNAGFLYGFLHTWDSAQTLQFANACGALAVQTVGGTGGYKNRTDVVSFLAKQVVAASRMLK